MSALEFRGPESPCEQENARNILAEGWASDACHKSVGVGSYGGRIATYRGTTRRASIEQCEGGWRMKLHPHTGPHVILWRRRGILRLSRFLVRWVARRERTCTVTVKVDGRHAGAFEAREGEQVAHRIKGLLPGWVVSSPVWVIPHDERDVWFGPRNTVSVRIDGGRNDG